MESFHVTTFYPNQKAKKIRRRENEKNVNLYL